MGIQKQCNRICLAHDLSSIVLKFVIYHTERGTLVQTLQVSGRMCTQLLITLNMAACIDWLKWRSSYDAFINVQNSSITRNPSSDRNEIFRACKRVIRSYNSISFFNTWRSHKIHTKFILKLYCNLNKHSFFYWQSKMNKTREKKTDQMNCYCSVNVICSQSHRTMCKRCAPQFTHCCSVKRLQQISNPLIKWKRQQNQRCLALRWFGFY